MAKKRNCRRSNEECVVHDKAVRLRKMTDEQLVAAFNSRSGEEQAIVGAADFINALENANLTGIGKVTIKKITTFAKENGYM